MVMSYDSLITLMMKAARISETPENFYKTTQSYNQEDSHCYKWLHLPNSHNQHT
jgi:hypothetical protein